MSASPRYRATDVGGCVAATLESRSDGSRILRSSEPLCWFPDRCQFENL